MRNASARLPEQSHQRIRKLHYIARTAQRQPQAQYTLLF